MQIKNFLFLTLPLLLLAQNVLARQPPPKPIFPEADRVRLAEAFEIRDRLGNRVWRNWRSVPFVVLLVTPETEFLIRYPKRPPADFEPLGYDRVLKSDVYFRRRTQPVSFLAAFPLVGGVSTVVVGQAEYTSAKDPTLWVVKVLHEHFHQLQDAQPRFFAEVDALNLAGGDRTGVWQLNYPFPYTAPDVKRQFDALGRMLAGALRARNGREFSASLAAYRESRRRFAKSLDPADYRYLSFQLWKEGVSRYTEYRVAELAGRRHRPSRQFRALKDYRRFGEVAREVREDILRELSALEFDRRRREAFYPFGAAEALLLDRAGRAWQGRYFADKFYLEKYFE